MNIERIKRCISNADEHKRLTASGLPRRLNGGKLGLRKRKMLRTFTAPGGGVFSNMQITMDVHGLGGELKGSVRQVAQKGDVVFTLPA